MVQNRVSNLVKTKSVALGWFRYDSAYSSDLSTWSTRTMTSNDALKAEHSYGSWRLKVESNSTHFRNQCFHTWIVWLVILSQTPKPATMNCCWNFPPQPFAVQLPKLWRSERWFQIDEPIGREDLELSRHQGWDCRESGETEVELENSRQRRWLWTFQHCCWPYRYTLHPEEDPWGYPILLCR